MRVIRQILRDTSILNIYMDGETPSAKKILQQAFVRERATDFKRPDHFFKNERERVFEGNAKSISAILLKTLETFSDTFLEFHNRKIYVQHDRFSDWQDELSRLSPLPIIAFSLYRKYGAPKPSFQGIRTYIRTAGLAQFRYSTILGVYNPILGDMVRNTGLVDLHVHLNGTTEVDKVWLHTLENFDRFGSQFLKGRDKEKVAELLSQIDPQLNHLHFLNRIKVARRIRIALAGYITGSHKKYTSNTFSDAYFNSYPPEETNNISRHPLPELMYSGMSPKVISGSSRIDEILMLVMIFDHLQKDENDDLAHLFHAYLLCWNALFVPMCVQSAEQMGFDQFQKFTDNEVREDSEKKYRDRFHQIGEGNPTNLVYVEGRIAPKSNPKKLINLLSNVLGGYQAYQQDNRGNDEENIPSYPKFSLYSQPKIEQNTRMELGLVIHFIKKSDRYSARSLNDCRHYQQRMDHFKQWRIFRQACKQSNILQHYFRGIDAAGNELDAPPETFAPLYRACRRDGVTNFTYHAGEDFENLIGGVRAVDEAVRFLDLCNGDRIGHATAIGISPELWLSSLPKKITVRQGDWFDDLVYARQVLQQETTGTALLGKIDSEIGRLCEILYGDASLRTDPSTFYRAWELRKLDPLFFDDAMKNFPPGLDDGMWGEWQFLRDKRFEIPMAYEIFRRYHEAQFAAKARKLISIDTDFLPADALLLLQQNVQRLVNSKQVVLEVLPTSNLRISFYQSYYEHHIFRWIDPGEGDEKMRVVLSTDDPGIFSTNIRNEFEHIMRELRNRKGTSNQCPEAMIRELNQNGHIFSFKHE